MATISGHLGSSPTVLQFKDKVLVVGISGGSCSGKSSLAKYICKKYPHSIDIHQDDFYLDDSAVPQSQEGQHLYDVPESLDCEKLVQSIREAMEKPHNFCNVCTTTRERRCSEQEHPSSPSSPSPSTSTSIDSLTTLRHLIVIEGTMILNIRGLRSLLQAALFITVDYATMSQRRRFRDYDGWMDPPGYFDDHVWPGYLRDKKLAESLTKPPIYVLDGGKTLEQLQGEMEGEVTKLL